MRRRRPPSGRPVPRRLAGPVYFIGDQHRLDRIQIDTSPAGESPFLIENGGRHQTSDPVEAATIIYNWLKQSRPPGNTG
jgi:hypothetical protein